MVAGRDFAHVMRGGIVSACEVACWSALGVSLAALMWAVVEPKGAMPPPLDAGTSGEQERADALVTRLSQSHDPFMNALTAGARTLDVTQEASGFVLHGTRAGWDGNGSAIIAAAGGSQKAYVVGEQIANGARLATVSTDHVELDVGGQLMRLSFPQSLTRDSLVLASRVADAPVDYRGSAGSSPLLLNSLALQPVSRNGRPAGFEIMPQANGGFLSAAGLRAGDVLVSINGIEASAGGDLSAYRAQLTSGQPVHIRYERGGQVLTTTLGTRQ